MNRREFLQVSSTATIVGGFASLVPFGGAKAQSKQDTLLVVSENGPNNLDVQGIGTNRPGYEVSTSSRSGPGDRHAHTCSSSSRRSPPPRRAADSGEARVKTD
jgi:hypothetical protein